MAIIIEKEYSSTQPIKREFLNLFNRVIITNCKKIEKKIKKEGKKKYPDDSFPGRIINESSRYSLSK